jgi:tRNA(Ile)-lysidine synthase
MDLIRNIQRTVADHRLFRPGTTVVVGVSGGADSVCLLHCLNQLQFELGIRLHVVHVHHGLRKSAETDRKFVEKLARQLRLPLSTTALNPKHFPKNRSLEEAAREERFKALITTAQKMKSTTIALGHTRDDLAETVLMRIIRGTGLLGMQGILPSRKIRGMDFVRPLLEIKKTDIEKFLSKHKLPFRKDPSNRSQKFFRNKIRLHLLPLLEQHYNPNIRETLANLAANVYFDYEFLENEAQKILNQLHRTKKGSKEITLALREVQKLHPAVRRLLLRLAVEQIKGDTRRLTATHSREMEELIFRRPPGSIVNLPGIAVQKRKTSLLLGPVR